MIRAVDICAGAGGFHLGLASIGEVVLAVEKNKAAQATYRTNFPDTPLEGDVKEVRELPEHDLLCAGFPCQPFSLASNMIGGKPRGLLDPRGTLIFDIVRLLKASRPAAFLLENVPALRSADGGRAFATICAELEGAGYVVESRVINAAPWVPQNRKRLFFMGIRADGGDYLDALFRLKALKVEQPPPPHPVLADILHEFVDPEHAPGPMSKKLHAQLVQRDADNAKAGRGFRSNLVGADGVANTVIARYASANRCSENLILMPDLSFDLTHAQKELIRYFYKKRGRKGDIVRDINLPVPTLCTRAPQRSCEKAILVGDCERIRRITPREAARLMGFPEWFVLPDSEAQAYKQMGNAVVPPVVAALVQAMLPLIKNIL